MQFMTRWRPGKGANAPTEKVTADMGNLIEDMPKGGVLVKNGGWDPASPCTVLRNSAGKVTVTDGPFAEAKEVIAGFAILNVESWEEAIDWSKRILAIAGAGTSEMRQIPEEAPQR